MEHRTMKNGKRQIYWSIRKHDDGDFFRLGYCFDDDYAYEMGGETCGNTCGEDTAGDFDSVREAVEQAFSDALTALCADDDMDKVVADCEEQIKNYGEAGFGLYLDEDFEG